MAGAYPSMKSWFTDVVPFWRWKVQEGKKFGRQVDYKTLLNACRKSQYFLAVFSAMVTISFEHSRHMFFSAIFRDGLLLFLMEFATFFILGYLMGIKRFPANYVPLVIMKCFIVLENRLQPKLRNFELKVLQGRSRYQGQWSALTANQAAAPVEAHWQNLLLFGIALTAAWTITRFTKMDLSKYERGTLVATTLASSTAASLLVTTFGFDAYPEMKQSHLRLCELWVVFATATFAFIITFLYQRLRSVILGSLKFVHYMRLQWEILIFLITVYIMIRYIPIIHAGFSVRTVISQSVFITMKALLPDSLLNALFTISNYANAVGEQYAAIQASQLKAT